MNNYTKKETDKYGHTYYYNDKDELHRLDGPAIEGANGGKAWCVDGKFHRLDGPAVEWTDGDKEWWVNGKRLTEEEFNRHPLVVEKRVNGLIKEVLGE